MATLLSIDGERVGEYDESNTEQALEEFCRSFGTRLNRVYLNPQWPFLVRLSYPIILKTRRGKRILQAQYTKYSVFSVDQETIRQVFQKAEGGKELSSSAVQKRLRQTCGRSLVN